MSDDDVVHELNSWQMLLFRINLIVLPVLLVSFIGLGTWLVQSQHRMTSTMAVMEERLSKAALKDSVRIQILEIRERIHKEVKDQYPPQDLVDDVKENKKELRYLLEELRKRAPNE